MGRGRFGIENAIPPFVSDAFYIMLSISVLQFVSSVGTCDATTIAEQPPLTPMFSDIRLAFRQLGKSPVFTIVVLATLALGIGANTAIFSLVNSVLLKPLPYPDADRIVTIGERSEGDGSFGNYMNFPGATVLFEDAKSFEALTLIRPLTWNLTRQGSAQKIDGLGVSSGFLQVYGIKPLFGRGFLPEEDTASGNHAVTILTHAYWSQAFAADPNIIGQTIELSGVAHEVVGVLHPDALWQEEAALLTPESIGDEAWKRNPKSWWHRLSGRLKSGVSLAQANAEMNALMQVALAGDVESLQYDYGVLPLQDYLVQYDRDSIPLLLVGVILLLLVASANVANLLLARATARRKEIAVRAALGAGQVRLLRQIMTESVVLALLGGSLGILAAGFGVDLMALAMPSDLPSVLNPKLDNRVLLASVLVAVGTGLAVGLVPAWRAWKVNVNRDLTDAGRGSTAGGRSGIQSLLVVAEVALTVVLLIGTGYLLRSYANTLKTDQGFDPHNVIVGRMSLDGSKLPGIEEQGNAALLAYHRALRRELATLPGVKSVATADASPFDGREGGQQIYPSGNPDGVIFTDSTHISGDYFGTLGMRLIRGRVLTEDDDRLQTPPVAVINERLAERLFPGEDPIGKRVFFANVHHEVVGLVGNTRQRSMTEDFLPYIYRSHRHNPWNISVLIRAQGSPEMLAGLIRDAVKRVNPGQAIYEIRTINAFMSDSISGERIVLLLIAVFGASALALACLGIYGVMAYTIEQRKRELSIRMALGALVSDILQMVMRDGLKLGAMGIGLGIVGGVVCGQLIQSQLYEVNAIDPIVFTTAIGIIAVLLWGSVLIPAKRATEADPADVLRND